MEPDPVRAAESKDPLVEEILHGGGPRLRDLFEAEGAKRPHVQWAPELGDLANPLVLDFAKRCGTLGNAPHPIGEADSRIKEFEHLLPWMMVLEVEGGGEAFRYSHYGEGIARVRGLAMLGQTSADFGGHIGLFFTSVYRAMMQRREWLRTVHVAPKQVFARTWERLIVPVANRQGQVTRFVAINVPDNELRAGLEIIPDPVLVLDADQTVRYANTAARRLFDRNQFQTQDLSLFEYTGIDLDIRNTPAELVSSHTVHNKTCLAMRNNLLRDCLLTISGARVWDHDFYVITLRMDIRGE